MKNTRKLFAGLTALCCTGTLLTAFSVSAESEFSETEFFVVTKTYPESSYYMLEYFHDNALHRTCCFQTDMKLSYGDILLADNGFTTERMENYQAVYELSLNKDTTLQNIGNCTDLMEHKKMTVKSMGYDGRPIQPSFRFFTYTLADEDGKEYYYSAEDSFGSDVSVVFSTGDVVEFAVYSGGAVIPLPEEKLPDCIEPFVYEYAVIGTDNAENPNKYVLIDSGGDTWYTSSRNFETPLSVGDTITIQNAMIGVTNIEGTNDLMISPEDGYQVQKTGSILDNPQTAEFTVQEIETGSPFGDRVYLEKDGTQYRIFTDWIEKNYAEYSWLDWSAVSVGDTVACVLYENYPVLGIDPDASAEPSVNNSYDYAVIGTDNAENPNKYVLIDSGGDTWYTSSRNFETPLSVGDTITIQNAMIGVTNIEGTNDLMISPEDGYQVQKTGSILNNPQTAEFTVQEIETGSPFGDRVYLEKDGTQYRIFTDWIEKNYAEYSWLDWSAVSVGDTVTCVLYDDYPVLGTERTPETVPDLTGDADGSGKLDILDVIIVNRAILGKEDISPDRISDIDFNGNNKPDAEDALIMMKKIVGLL